jgi:hypothetical protein
LVVSSENQRSTRLSQELEVGVKCTTKRGWGQQPALDCRGLAGGDVVHHQAHREVGGDLLVDGGQELLELDRPVPGVQLSDDLAGW